MEFTSGSARIVRLDGLLLALLFVSLGLNIYLGIAKIRPASIASRPTMPSVGSLAPIFKGTTRNGEIVRLDYSQAGKETLLYVFSPTCHWCERNLANIRAVVNSRPDLNIVGVSIGPELDSRTIATLPFSKILRPDAATMQAFHFGGTPETVLISGDGHVLQAWAGAYAGQTATQVSQVLTVTLPGLLEN